MIALSQAMLVIEAGEKGGSLDAGLKSIDYGKRLFVPQYAEFPTSALGNALLIQHGAYPLRMKRSSFYLSVSPARRAPPFSPSLSSIVFSTPSVPLTGDRNPQEREDITALLCYICPTCPSPAGGSLIHSQALALSKRARDVTALRCSEPLRYKVGGASKPSPYFAG